MSMVLFARCGAKGSIFGGFLQRILIIPFGLWSNCSVFWGKKASIREKN